MNRTGTARFALIALLAAPLASAQRTPASEVEALNVELATGVLKTSVEADGVLDHRIYMIEEPLQVVLDILNVRNGVEDHSLPDANPFLSRVVSQELPMNAYDKASPRGKTFARFIFELKQPVWHSLSLHPGRLELGLHSIRPVAASTPVSKPLVQEPVRFEPLEDVTESRPAAQPIASPIAKTENALDVDLPEGLRIEPNDVDPRVFFGAPSGGAEHYQIGPEDLIEVRVFETEQLNRTVRVESDGTIILPLIGPVNVLGLTAPQAAEQVAVKLRGEFVDDPQVTVLIQEFHSRRVSLLGAVERAGAYPLMGERNLLEVLAESGGLTEGAGSVLYVFRRLSDGRNARLSIPLSELLVRGDPRWNIRLRPGDVVSIPPDAAISISVVGAVRSPGVYKLPASEGATVLRAIALAGGLKDRASKDLQVKRQSTLGAETLLKVDLGAILSGKKPDVVLREGDVVIVNHSFF